MATRRAFPRVPGLRVIERPGWLQIITPQIKTGGLNEVIFSALDERDADATIDATIAEYRDLGLLFRWSVGPGSAPADLGERLSRRGLVASFGRGMARSTAGDERRDDAAVRVTLVDAATVDEFTRVMASGWKLDHGPLAAIHASALTESPGRQPMFLAWLDDVPAASASYVALARSAYLVGAVVLESARGRGLYRALVHARLSHAGARGIELATCHARETSSAPMLEHMGFETVCRFPMYFG